MKEAKETRLLIYAYQFAVYNYVLWRFFLATNLI